VFNALKLIALGSGVLMFGVLGVAQIRKHPILQLLTSVSIVVLAQFFLLATNKPAEYARFAIVGDIALVILAFAGIANLRIRAAYPACLIATLLTGVLGVSYVWHFMIDSTARSTRIIAAERVQRLGPAEISLAAEPAPYAMPPVDLFRTRLVLHGASADLSMRTVDQIGTSPGAEYWFRPRVLPTPISWAHKPFEVRINKRATVPSAR